MSEEGAEGGVRSGDGDGGGGGVEDGLAGQTCLKHPEYPSGRLGFRVQMDRVLERVSCFRPDLVLVSAGFDGAHGDEGNGQVVGGVYGDADPKPCRYCVCVTVMVYV